MIKLWKELRAERKRGRARRKMWANTPIYWLKRGTKFTWCGPVKATIRIGIYDEPTS